MINGGERNALKGSREKITRSELKSNRQPNTLASDRFYNLGSATDGLTFPTRQRGSYFRSLGRLSVSPENLCVTYGMNRGKKVSNATFVT